MSEAEATADHAGTRQRIAAMLREAAEATADPRYRIALGIVAGGKPGRRACNDAESLAAMSEMLGSGQAGSVEQAARFMARGLVGEQSQDAAIKRLACKFRAAGK